MATEILHIPEKNLLEVITVIRTGLDHLKDNDSWIGVSSEVAMQLERWCREEERYLRRLGVIK